MTNRALLSCLVLVALCFAASGRGEPPESRAKKPNVDAAEKPKEAVATKAVAAPFKDEPAAHALYNQMIEAMRNAKSLSYVSHYGLEGNKGFKMDCTYRAWLKKPNYFRVEAEVPAENKKKLLKAPEAGGGHGILIGDGKTLWIYWPEGRFNYGDDPETYKKTRLTSYMTKPAPPGGHSIGHETGFLGAGMSMPIIDPSTFFGYTDSLQPYLDGVKSLGSEKVARRRLRRDRSEHHEAPAKLVSVAVEEGSPAAEAQGNRTGELRSYHQTEDWSSVIIDGDIPNTMFAWKPPAGWTQWKLPPIEAGLLKPGTKAPDFELASAEGKKIKLSDFRGQVIWFYVWRAG